MKNTQPRTNPANTMNTPLPGCRKPQGANPPVAGFLPPDARRRKRYAKLENRDRDFLLACRRILAASSRPLTVAALTAMAAASPAPGYYLSFNHVMRVMMRMPYFRALSPLTHTTARPEPVPGNPAAAKRYAEIASRARALLERNSGMTLAEAVAAVLGGGASSFFISPEAARRLYSDIMARRRGSNTITQLLIL